MEVLLGTERNLVAQHRQPYRGPLTDTVLLDTLVANLASVGVTATHRVEGHRRPLPEELRQALLRIAREGMVNAVKHAPGAPIELVLAYRPGEVELTVANGSPTGAPSAPLPGSGLGLAGLTVLADKLGGSLRHGPSHGGHRLTATLPAP